MFPQRKSISVNISRPKKMRSLGLKKKCGEPIKSAEDVKALDERWQSKSEDAFCYLHEFQIVN